MAASAPSSTPLLEAAQDYLQHLAVQRGLADNTLAAYRRDLRRYVTFLVARPVHTPSEVDARTVADFAASLARASSDGPALSAASAARVIVAVRGWHRYLLATGVTEVDPASDVKPPTPAKRLPKALSVEQVSDLLAAADDETPAGLRDRALVEVLYGTGARITEATSLDIDDVSDVQSEGVIRLVGKGGKERIVPMGSYAVSALQAYLVRARPIIAGGGRGVPAVFLNLRGGRLSRQSAWSVLKRCAHHAGITGHVSPHVLRHSYATHLVEAGADVRVVQELLGHASVTTTQVYTLVTDDQLRTVYASSHPRAQR